MLAALWDKGAEYIVAFATLWGALYATGTLEDLGLVEPEMEPIADDLQGVLFFTDGPEPVDPVTIWGGIIVSIVIAFAVWAIVHWWRNR